MATETLCDDVIAACAPPPRSVSNSLYVQNIEKINKPFFLDSEANE